MGYNCNASLIIITFSMVMLTVLFGLFLGPFECFEEENKTCFGKTQLAQLLNNYQTWADIDDTCDLEMLIEDNQKIMVRKSMYMLEGTVITCQDLEIGAMYPVIKKDKDEYEFAYDDYEFYLESELLRSGFIALVVLSSIASTSLFIATLIVVWCLRNWKRDTMDPYKDETGKKDTSGRCPTGCQIGWNVTFIVLTLFCAALVTGMALKMGPYNCLGSHNKQCFDRAKPATLVNNYPSTTSICYLEFKFTNTNKKFVILRDNIAVQPNSPECYDLIVGEEYLVVEQHSEQGESTYMLASDDVNLWLLTEKIRQQCWNVILAFGFLFLMFGAICLGVSKGCTRWKSVS